MPISVSIDLPAFNVSREAAEKVIRKLGEDASRKTIIEAGNEGLINALRRHFANREKEQHKTAGIPWFGQNYPKRYFWRGTRGTSLAEQIKVVLSSPARLESIVAIESPALKHKLATNPPPITPKGGKRYLAIPANPTAASWDGMPRDFPKELSFKIRPTPDGHWLPCLVAEENYKTSGGKLATGKKKAVSGEQNVMYWLVHKVKTKHDPRALPEKTVQVSAVTSAVRTAIQRILASLTAS